MKIDTNNYVFDIDGTLTPSRGKILDEFKHFFLEWMKGKNVYFITGSDKNKTVEQIGEEIWNKATRCYQSCGNAVYEKGKLIRQLDLPLSKELDNLLREFLLWSQWTERYTTNIEPRIGLINFSVIGRDCPQEAREKYAKWDNKTKERLAFCDIIHEKFPELEASVGGQISIDIYLKGKNKSQILKDISGPVIFFGDKCKPGGNDFPIVDYLFHEGLTDYARKYKVHEVTDYRDTWSVLTQDY